MTTRYAASTGTGSALVYERTDEGGWAELTALINPSRPGDTVIARSVAISDETIVVVGYGVEKNALTGQLDYIGARLAAYQNSGADIWKQTTLIEFPFNEPTHQAFNLVDVSGRTFVAGSIRGYTSIYEQSSDGDWRLNGSLEELPIDHAADPSIETWRTIDSKIVPSVAIENDTIVAGVLAGEQSHARIYRRRSDGWKFSEVIPLNATDELTFRAIDVALDGDNLLVGLPGGPNQPGTALLYTLVPEPMAAVTLLAVLGFVAAVRRR